MQNPLCRCHQRKTKFNRMREVNVQRVIVDYANDGRTDKPAVLYRRLAATVCTPSIPENVRIT